MFSLVFIASLNAQLTICRYNSQGVYIGDQGGCYNLVPVYDWIKRCVISIFMCVDAVIDGADRPASSSSPSCRSSCRS